MPYLGNVYLSEQIACGIEHRQHTVATPADFVHYLTEFHIWTHRLIVAVDDTVKTHQREHCVVGVMGDELTLACQSHTIDAMRLKYIYSKVRAHGNNHQRHEEIVSCGYLGYEEHSRERCVHNSRHHSRHTQEGIVFLWQKDTYLIYIPQAREEETGETTDEKTRCKRTSATASAVSCRCGKHLGEEHKRHIQQQHVSPTRKERVAHDAVPVGLGLAVEQKID